MLAQATTCTADQAFPAVDEVALNRRLTQGRVAQLVARLRSTSLAGALAGEDPAGSPQLAARAAALGARDTRAAIADQLDGLLQAAEHLRVVDGACVPTARRSWPTPERCARWPHSCVGARHCTLEVSPCSRSCCTTVRARRTSEGATASRYVSTRRAARCARDARSSRPALWWHPGAPAGFSGSVALGDRGGARVHGCADRDRAVPGRERVRTAGTPQRWSSRARAACRAVAARERSRSPGEAR